MSHITDCISAVIGCIVRSQKQPFLVGGKHLLGHNFVACGYIFINIAVLDLHLIAPKFGLLGVSDLVIYWVRFRGQYVVFLFKTFDVLCQESALSPEKIAPKSPRTKDRLILAYHE